MKFDVISSGSKGNATIIVSHGKAILLDFGISKKRINSALNEFGLGFNDLNGIFISHDHSDHSSNAFSAPFEKIYASTVTLPKIDGMITGVHLLKPLSSVYVDGFSVLPIPLSHDAPNTVGFVISDGEESLAYITDTGFVPEKVFEYLKGLNYYIFESNHDPEMLFNSGRPDYLIRRIISDKGHLSNADSAYYLANFITKETKEVVLAHLSDQCNTPQKAKDAFDVVTQSQLGFIPDVCLKTASDFAQTKGGD
ncbi:MAG: MBL fold metallo-hydrolase [Bacilli bacterium]